MAIVIKHPTNAYQCNKKDSLFKNLLDVFSVYYRCSKIKILLRNNLQYFVKKHLDSGRH